MQCGRIGGRMVGRCDVYFWREKMGRLNVYVMGILV